MGKLKPGQMSNAHLSGLIRQVLLCERWCGEEEGLLEKASNDPHFAEISGQDIKDWVVGKWNEHETRKTLVLYRKMGGTSKQHVTK